MVERIKAGVTICICIELSQFRTENFDIPNNTQVIK